MKKVPPPVFQCREAWGGNKKIEQDIEIGDLRGFLLSRPYNASEGGDLHFLSFCEEENISKIVIADVSGHGDIVSRAASAIKGLLQKYIDELDNSRLLESINRSVRRRLFNGKFVTMVAATYRGINKELIYAYAGHPTLLQYQKAERNWQVLHAPENGGMPLGIIGNAGYFQIETRLNSGDLLLFYTDGLLNVKINSTIQISIEELLSFCRSLNADRLRPREISESLIKQITRSSSAGFTDDVTLLVLEAA